MNARRLAIALSIIFLNLLTLCAPGTAAAAWGPWARIETLEGQLQTAAGKNAAFEQQVSKLQAANTQCGREKAETSIALGRLEESLAEKVRWLEASQREVFKLSRELATVNVANDQLGVRAETAERLLAGVRSSLVALREKVAQATARAEDAEMRLGAVATGALRLQLGFDGLRDVIGRLSEQVSDLNNEALLNSHSSLVGSTSLALILTLGYYLLLLKEKRRPALVTSLWQAEKEALLSRLAKADTELLDNNTLRAESNFCLGKKLSINEEKTASLERELAAVRLLQGGAVQAIQGLSAEREAATMRNTDLSQLIETEKGRSDQLSRELATAERRIAQLASLNEKRGGLVAASNALIEELRGKLGAQTVAPTPPRRSKAGTSKPAAVKRGRPEEGAPAIAPAIVVDAAPAEESGAGSLRPPEELPELPPASAIPPIPPQLLKAVGEGSLPTVEVEDETSGTEAAEADDIGELEPADEAPESASISEASSLAQRFAADRRPKKDTLH